MVDMVGRGTASLRGHAILADEGFNPQYSIPISRQVDVGRYEHNSCTWLQFCVTDE